MMMVLLPMNYEKKQNQGKLDFVFETKLPPPLTEHLIGHSYTRNIYTASFQTRAGTPVEAPTLQNYKTTVAMVFMTSVSKTTPFVPSYCSQCVII